MKEELESQFEEYINETPLILVEPSVREWKQYKPYSIHFSGASIYNTSENKAERYNNISYDTYEFGTHLQKYKDDHMKEKLECISNVDDEKLMIDELLIDRMRKMRLFLTTTKEDALKINPNALFVTTSNKLSCSTHRHKPSGVVIIAVCQKTDEKSHCWTEDIQKKLRFSKPNIVNNKKTAHFDSQGYIASFGNKGFYGMVDDSSSVNQYANKQSTNKQTQKKIDDTATELEMLCALQVNAGVSLLNRVLSQTSDIIAPLLKVGFDLQVEHGDINFQEVATSQDGLWHSEICENAITKIFHTERDPTYTLICTPEQSCGNANTEERKHTTFLFKVNQSVTFGLRMVNSLSFMFHGLMISHKQHCDDGYEDKETRDKKEKFYNIACYGNERLYRHIKKSFYRKKEAKKEGKKDP